MPARRQPAFAPQRIPAAERQAAKPKRHPAQVSRLPRMTEAQFYKQVTDLAELLGWAVWHDAATNAPRLCYRCGARTRGPRNTAGLPDLLLVRGNRAIWAELKAQDGCTSPEQRAWIAALRAAGLTVLIWRPSDWPEIERTLAR